jgi:elongation factor 1-gamma
MYKNCYNSRVLLLLKQLTNLQIQIVYLDKLDEANIKKVTNKSPTKTLPLLGNGEFYLSGTSAISHYIIMLDEKFTKQLIGNGLNEENEVCMWINYIILNIWPLYDHIIGQITGSNPTNQEIYQLACCDLMTQLVNINDTLKFKSFLVGSNLTIADLFLAVSLYPYFSMVLTDDCRSKITNVTRLYLFASNVKQFQAVCGKARLCQVTQKPSDVPIPTKIVKEEIKEQKPKEEKTKEVKNKQLKKDAQKEQTKPKEEAKDDIEDGKKEKKINPLDSLPPSKFELDAFKKEFLNSKDKQSVLNDFWTKFDPDGFSIWFIHYQKSADQGRLAFKTKNLRSNFLQKVDNFRKYTFAVHGVYGQEPDLQIEGVWMWRGKNIPEEVV